MRKKDIRKKGVAYTFALNIPFTCPFEAYPCVPAFICIYTKRKYDLIDYFVVQFECEALICLH